MKWRRRCLAPEEEYIAQLNEDAKERALHPPTTLTVQHFGGRMDASSISAGMITAKKIYGGTTNDFKLRPRL